MEEATLGSFVGDYELVVGDRGKESFTIKIPQQWRNFEGGRQLLTQGPSIVKNQGLQCLIVGNPFLQALAVTFAPRLSPPTVYFSHLDLQGRRSPEYAGPRSIVSKQQDASDLVALPQTVRSGRIPLRDGQLHVPSLVDTSLATAAPPGASSRKASDVTLDLRFMKFPTKPAAPGDAGLISEESKSAADLIIPCLDVLIVDEAGNKVYNTHIFDTGSGVNLALDVALNPRTSSPCPEGSCYCASPGTVGATFARSVASTNNGAACGPCTQPALQSKQNGAAGICNTFCCTSEGVSCDDAMPCSVIFCTGVVSYQPTFAQMSFPSENAQGQGRLHLQNLPRVFAGKAQAACVPGVQSGLFGAWYWDSPLQSPGGGAIASEAAGLPYYLLEALGQIGTENENYTLKFWRSDLKKAARSMQVGADSISNSQKAPTRPWWDDEGGDGPAPSPPSPAPSPPRPPPSPVQPPSQPPAQPPSQPPAQPPSQPPSQPPAQPPSQPPAQPPSQPPAQAPSQPLAQPPSQPSAGSTCSETHKDVVGENGAGGTQQIVIVTGGAHEHGAASAKLASASMPPTSAGSGGKRDWLLIGLAIAGVGLLALLLLMFARQTPSDYALLPETGA